MWAGARGGVPVLLGGAEAGLENLRMDIAAAQLIAQVLVGLMVAGTLELNAAITQLERMKQEVEKKSWRKRTELGVRMVGPWQARFYLTCMALMALALSMCVTSVIGGEPIPPNGARLVAVGIAAGMLLVVLFPVLIVSDIADRVDKASSIPGAGNATRSFLRSAWTFLFVVMPLAIALVLVVFVW